MASPAHSAMSDRPWVNTLISRGCSCRHAIVLKGHEKINLQCKCHIIETEHEANSGKPRKHIRSRKDGRYAGMANSGIPSCCLALLDQVSSKTPGPPAMWNFRPCSTSHTHTHTHARAPISGFWCSNSGKHNSASIARAHSIRAASAARPGQDPRQAVQQARRELRNSSSQVRLVLPNSRRTVFRPTDGRRLAKCIEGLSKECKLSTSQVARSAENT